MSGRCASVERARDRVVVGDRHEVHPAALGELVDLLRLGCALRQVQGTLDSQLRQLGCRRMHVHVGPARFCSWLDIVPASCGFCEEGAHVL